MHIAHSKHPLPTTQEKTLHMDITRWIVLKSDWLYSLKPKMEKLYTVSKNKTGSWLWLISQTFIVKFRLKLKKVGKTTRTFIYDLNQVCYNYTVKVTDRFKGLHLTECLKNCGQRFVTWYRRQWSKLSREINANSLEKKRSKRQARKGKINPLEYRVPKNSKER